MPVEWNFKKWLVVERNIYRPSELQELIAERTGVRLSLQAITALVNGKPSGMRFQTMQAVCNTLNCNICEFFSITPDSEKDQQKQRKVVGETPRPLYGSKAKKEVEKPESIFPSPRQQKDSENNREKRN